MKTTPFVAMCILLMCIATLDSLAQTSQCNGFNPWIRIQWPNSSSLIDWAPTLNDKDYVYDFGDVDMGLTATLPIRFHNCHTSDTQPSQQIGTPLRNFQDQIVNCSGSSTSEWNASPIVDFDIPAINPGQNSSIYNIIFTAETAGVREALLVISYYDSDFAQGDVPSVSATTCSYTPGANPAATLTIKFRANVIVPTPVNSILVVDRSGSMADPAYTMSTPTRKIDALQSALSVYYDALKPIDNLAVVKFNSAASTIVPFATKGTNPLPANIDVSSTGPGKELEPTGSTSIGYGFQEGINISNAHAAPTGFKNQLILQTDGIQNSGIDYTSVAYNPAKVNIYTVGLGPDVNDTYLIGISGANRFFKVMNDPLGAGAADLGNFYFKIHAQANNLSMVTDPTVLVNLASGPQTAFNSILTLADKEAMFLVMEGGDQRKQYKIELVNPKGDVVTAATTIGGVAVEVTSNEGHTIYKVHGATDNTFVGEWKLNVVPAGGCKENCKVPVSFSVAARSNLKMDMSTLSATYLPGSAITITSRLTESRLALMNASVIADIRTPEGKKFNGLRLLDDGNGVDQFAGDGVYSAQFIETSAIGTYEVKVKSLVKTLKGQTTTRENVQYVPLQFPNTQALLPIKDCITCTWKWIIIVVVIALLILVLIRLRKR